MDKWEQAMAIQTIKELLLGGAHEGPCTNEDMEYDSCDLHVATAKARDERARQFLERLSMKR